MNKRSFAISIIAFYLIIIIVGAIYSVVKVTNDRIDDVITALGCQRGIYDRKSKICERLQMH